MTLTHVALVRRAGGGGEVDAAVLRDILWAHVLAGDPVEHISVRAGPGPRLEIGVFTGPAGDGAPTAIAHELVERVLRRSPSLDRWMLAEIRLSSLSSIPAHDPAIDCQSTFGTKIIHGEGYNNEHP
jgi:hypothetical protein